jgi:hypothetical protein
MIWSFWGNPRDPNAHWVKFIGELQDEAAKSRSEATMTDDTERRLDDIEKRVQALEKSVWPFATAYAAIATPSKTVSVGEQWCECGKDNLLCRAPDCPSHRNDPLGR